MNKREIYKGLQNLFSWVEFYRTNERYSDLEKAQEQVEEYINKHNLKQND